MPILGSEDWKFGTITPFQHQNLEIFYTEAAIAGSEAMGDEMSHFTQEYVTRFGSEPDPFSTLGYDVGNYLFTALEKAGNPLYLRSEEHTSELQSRGHLVCRLLL